MFTFKKSASATSRLAEFQAKNINSESQQYKIASIKIQTNPQNN